MSYLGKGPGKIFMPPPGGSINWSQLDPATQLQLQSMFSGRNRLDNGDCRIIQRASGFSAPPGTLGYGACDRWKINNQLAAGTIYTSQTSFADQNGINKTCVFQRCDVICTTPTGSNSHSGIAQTIEGWNAYDLLGRQVTISFIFKANVTGIFSVTLRDGASVISYVNSFTYSTANVPQVVSFTTPPIPMAASIPFSVNGGLIVNIGAITGATSLTAPSIGSWLTGNYTGAPGHTNWANAVNNQINATDIQLEEGIVATPFERLPYQVQLARCQRYALGINGLSLGIIYNGSYTYGGCLLFPTTMRVAPVIMPGATYTVSGGTVLGTVALLNQSAVGCGFYNPTNNWSAGGGVVLNNAILSAEL